MDPQRAKERILENENLTDNLDDEAADWLLNWGIGHLNGLVGSIQDEDSAGEKINALMAVMRQLNRIGGILSSVGQVQPDKIETAVREFFASYRLIFPKPGPVKTETIHAAAIAVARMQPRAGV